MSKKIGPKSEMISFHRVRSRRELEHCFRIRTEVFVKEQGCPQRLEFDEYDKDAEHFLVTGRDGPVACARVRWKGVKTAKLERIAVLLRFRRQGIAAMMIRRLIARYRSKGAGKIIIHAQYHLKDYYSGFGFLPVGRIFAEAGIKHVKMILRLK